MAAPIEGGRNAVVIVGDGVKARRCAAAVIESGRGRLRLAGVVSLREFRRMIGNGFSPPPATRLVLALEERRQTAPVKELLELRCRGCLVQTAEAFLEAQTRKIPIESVGAGELAFGEGFRLFRWRFALKTMIEWPLALILAILTAPILAVAMIAIWLESGRPVIFRQERLGRGGRCFSMPKLRSMWQNAEKDGPRLAHEDDPRVTRVGRVLRRFRIDELPQLWSVLKFEMALVGPRPERPEFLDQFRELIPFFTLRMAVRPGLTGWAQVNDGYASDLDAVREKLAYDLYYIKHFSPRLDLEIMLRTARTVLLGHGL